MRIGRESFIRFAVAVALACYDLPTDRAMTSEEAAQLVKWVIDMALGPDASNVQVEPVLGDQPKDSAGNCTYYQESNPYWVDYQLAMDRFTPDYDYTNLAAFYVDLVEYLVMAVRLYFFIREQQFRSIDRGKYDELVGIQAVLQKPA